MILPDLSMDLLETNMVPRPAERERDATARSEYGACLKPIRFPDQQREREMLLPDLSMEPARNQYGSKTSRERERDSTTRSKDGHA